MMTSSVGLLPIPVILLAVFHPRERWRLGPKVYNVAGPPGNVEKMSKVTSYCFRLKYLETTDSSGENPLVLQYATSIENKTGLSLE